MTNHPQTSHPPSLPMPRAFKSLLADGSDVLCVAVTSKHSAPTTPRVWQPNNSATSWPYGTRFPSRRGERFQAEAAVEAARQGKSKDEILALLQDMRDRTHVFIVLDTIEYLKKGGRAAKFMPVMEKVAQLFNIKLILLFKRAR